MVSNHLIEHMSVAELLAQWPQLISLLNQYRTACVGCPLDCFCTLETVIAEYDLSREEFMQNVLRSIAGEEE